MPERLRRFLRPREGWVAYFLLFVMLLSLGWAVQRAGWIKQDDFLVPVALYASLLGALLGISRLSLVFTLPISAVAGTGVVLWAVGGEYYPAASQLNRLLTLRSDILDWTYTVIHFGYGSELTPYAIGLALVMWITAFIAAYTLYRHHRAIDAILLVGAFVVANLSATFIDLFFYLLLFCLAALLLWLRVALLTREDGWRLRRVTETVDVPASIMRAGIGFIVVSMILSWTLTSVAIGAPLTQAWRNLDTVWSSVQDNLSGLFGSLENKGSRFTASFPSSFTVSSNWTSQDRIVLTVGEKKAYYLATTTYDHYTGRGWEQTKESNRGVPAGQPIFPSNTPDLPTVADSFSVEQVTVQINTPNLRHLFTPGVPVKVFVPVVVGEPNGIPTFGSLDATTGLQANDGYQLNAVISTPTEAQLGAAGTNYPEQIKQLYLDTSDLSRVTQRTKDLARQIVQAAGATDPYHEAKALADYLRTSSAFTYATQDVPQPSPGQDLVDFFLFDSKEGFCQYYATAMVMMARSLGLPARMVGGYAPGSRLAADTYIYREKNSHNWAEVYFPGYGWQVFEATHSIPAVIRPAGAPAGSQAPGTTTPDELRRIIEGDPTQTSTLPSINPIPGGVNPSTGQSTPASSGDIRGGNVLLLLGLLVALALVIWWRYRVRTRRMRFLAPGDRQWRQLILAAERAGVTQRPSETDFEYAGWLEDQIPDRRPEIRTIAQGKVWGSYSGRGMGAETVALMEGAWRRLRGPLTRLAIRRRLRALIPRRSAG
ncbi:MAG: DUF4129 domain-containing transglutaminase family protein [Acidobacteriota bacterium]